MHNEAEQIVNCRTDPFMFWALRKRNLEGFRFLLKHGANPNISVAENEPRGQTLLSLAATFGEPEYLQELLGSGANPNLARGKTGKTAIFSAAFYQRTNNVALLLKAGADINWRCVGGHTPLEDAVAGSSFEMALYLYHAGASPLVTNALGYCAVDNIKQFGDGGCMLPADRVAYKQLVEEFKAQGWLKGAVK